MLDDPYEPVRAWDEIVPGLWMGGDLRSPEAFDHVVSLCAIGDAVTPGPEGQTCWFIDDADELPDLERLHGLAREVADRVERGEQVLVRCQAGLNRSGLLAGAVLAELGLDPEDALTRIRDRRGAMALCNPTFASYLLTRGSR